jgi:hypothetical protein
LFAVAGLAQKFLPRSLTTTSSGWTYENAFKQHLEDQFEANDERIPNLELQTQYGIA